MIGRSFALLFALLGCSSAPAAPAPPPTDAPLPTLESIQAKVFGPKCASAGCHHIDLPKASVSLANEELSYQSLVNQPPDDPALRSKYPARVVPGDPERSFLIRKLEGPTTGEGLRMPSGTAPLDAETVAAIRTWIERLPR